MSERRNQPSKKSQMMSLNCKLSARLLLVAICLIALTIIDDDFKRGIKSTRVASASPIGELAEQYNNQLRDDVSPLEIDHFSSERSLDIGTLVPGEEEDGPRILVKRDELKKASKGEEVEATEVEEEVGVEEVEVDEDEEAGESKSSSDTTGPKTTVATQPGPKQQQPNAQQPTNEQLKQNLKPSSTRPPSLLDPEDVPRILKGFGLGAGSMLLG